MTTLKLTPGPSQKASSLPKGRTSDFEIIDASSMDGRDQSRRAVLLSVSSGRNAVAILSDPLAFFVLMNLKSTGLAGSYGYSLYFFPSTNH